MFCKCRYSVLCVTLKRGREEEGGKGGEERRGREREIGREGDEENEGERSKGKGGETKEKGVRKIEMQCSERKHRGGE